MPEKTDLLRHTVATLAYRAAKVLRDAPPEFAQFRAGPTTRTPESILAHMGDLFDWALTIADGPPVWHDSAPLTWDREVERFFATLSRFDARLAGGVPLACAPEKLFQGPIADALTHTGQLAMLRRMAGSQIRGESYYRADIATGQVSMEQPPANVEFD